MIRLKTALKVFEEKGAGGKVFTRSFFSSANRKHGCALYVKRPSGRAAPEQDCQAGDPEIQPGRKAVVICDSSLPAGVRARQWQRARGFLRSLGYEACQPGDLSENWSTENLEIHNRPLFEYSRLLMGLSGFKAVCFCGGWKDERNLRMLQETVNSRCPAHGFMTFYLPEEQ